MGNLHKHENSKDSKAQWGIYMSFWMKEGKVGSRTSKGNEAIYKEIKRVSI